MVAKSHQLQTVFGLLTGDPQYALDLAVAEVVRAGVAVMVAAGNGDTDACLKSPARSAVFSHVDSVIQST